MCEFVWGCGSYYSTRRAALVKKGQIASKIIPEKFFWLTCLVWMGYEYFYQNLDRWLLLSMLISIESPLQILILDNFFIYFFYQCSPYHRVVLASTTLRGNDPMPPPRPRPLAATSTSMVMPSPSRAAGARRLWGPCPRCCYRFRRRHCHRRMCVQFFLFLLSVGWRNVPTSIQ